MLYLGVLTLVTLIYLVFGAMIWMRTRNLAFVVGLALIYYWTYYGAWFIVADLLRGHSELRYEYLYAKLFPVYLDEAYLWTLVTYGGFLLSVEGGLLLFVHRYRERARLTPYVSHTVLLGIGCFCGLLSFFVIRDSLGTAAQMNLSGYEFVRINEQAAGMYKIHQLLMRCALFSVTTGLAIMLSGPAARVVTGKRSAIAMAGYLVLLTGLVAINVILGQRRALAAEAISAGLFYLANARRPNLALIFGGTAFMCVAMGFVSMTRGGGVAPGTSGWETIQSSLVENLVSNEPFAAHLSLYGSIAYKIPPTYGSSLMYLASSFFPGARRPTEIYDYYVERVMAIEGQGYTVHHAAAWYLNFGAIGVMAGGALLGIVWAGLYAAFQRRTRIGSHMLLMAATFGIWNFTAFLPSLCREGPEGYKGVALEVIAIPTLIMAAATVRAVLIDGRPSVVPVCALSESMEETEPAAEFQLA